MEVWPIPLLMAKTLSRNTQSLSIATHITSWCPKKSGLGHHAPPLGFYSTHVCRNDRSRGRSQGRERMTFQGGRFSVVATSVVNCTTSHDSVAWRCRRAPPTTRSSNTAHRERSRHCRRSWMSLWSKPSDDSTVQASSSPAASAFACITCLAAEMYELRA